jgi:small subunit ribosomal protein S1
MEDKIWEKINSWGYPAIVVILVALVLVKPEGIKLLVGWVWYFLSKIVFSSLRRKAIGLGVEARCTSAIKNFSKETPGFSLPEMQIRWVTEENVGIILQDGKAIVKLNYSYNDPKNVVAATSQYVKSALLSRTKPYLDISLKGALDFSIIKKILLSIRRFQNDYFTLYLTENPILDPAVRQKCAILEEIDDSGLLTRIVLKELDSFGSKIAGRLPAPEYNEEAHRFIDFIYRIANREYDEQTDLLFEDRFINVAIVLVAKTDTFEKHGVAPYLRRIKLALAKGVEDFYLLARNEKVDILKQVAKSLLDTGFFVQEHRPLEYKDFKKRPVICYYFKINKDSLIATATKEIASAKGDGTLLNGVITRVTSNYLKVDYNGIEGIVRKENISTIPIDDISPYFQEGELLELRAVDTNEDGLVNFETKSTKSDPNLLLQQNLSIGKLITGKIRHIDDDFIIIDLPGFKIEGIAFRQDLTYSRYIFLHEKFQIDEELAFNISGYDFSKARVKVALHDLKDPWEDFHSTVGEVATFKVMRKLSKSFIGEIKEGIEGILYYSELAWLSEDAEAERNKIKLSDTIDCRIDKINRKDRFLTLSCKINNSPIEEYFKVNKDTTVDFIITSITTFGINGLIDNRWNIYVPNYLQTWNGKPAFQYKVGAKYKVYIKAAHDAKEKLIGSFREILTHPLEPFRQKYPEGTILGKCKVKSCHEWGCLIEIKVGSQPYEAVLFKGELTDKCHVNSAKGIFDENELIPLVVKEFDWEKNKVLMSLKELFRVNRPKVENLRYEDSYDSQIAAAKGKNYVVFIRGFWLDGILETSKVYNTGELIKVRPIRKDEKYLLLTDE